jgi:hypothetical protein
MFFIRPDKKRIFPINFLLAIHKRCPVTILDLTHKNFVFLQKLFFLLNYSMLHSLHFLNKKINSINQIYYTKNQKHLPMHSKYFYLNKPISEKYFYFNLKLIFYNYLLTK